MAELRDAQGAPAGSQDDALSADALYSRGMAHYRRRQWQQARESFRGLKKLDPGRRGIDALLDELDIFIRLEALAPNSEPGQAASMAQAVGPRAAPGLRGRVARIRPAWLAPACVAAVALALVVYGVLNPRLGQRVAELRSLGRVYRAAGQWPQAINTYEELLLLAPNDREARDSLWAAYYERGDQRATGARALEERQQYGEAVGLWEKALADFRAAREVDPNHGPDGRGDPSARIAGAERGQRCAALLAQAASLRYEGRWVEAIQVLQALSAQAPDYRPERVREYLGAAFLQAGLDAVARATSTAEVRAGTALLAQAAAAQPGSAEAALQRANDYLRAMVDAEGKQWDLAVKALEGLLAAEPGYAGGHARQLLCRSYWQRAEERYGRGLLRQALADYRAVQAMACDGQAEATRKVELISLALTPTATPRPLPTWTPAATALTITPGPSPTPGPAQGPAEPLPTPSLPLATGAQ